MSVADADRVPSLKSSVATCQVAAAFAKKEAEDAIQEWWTQPAVHAVPWVKCKSVCFCMCASIVVLCSICCPIMLGNASYSQALYPECLVA